jgi:hypothetical protein
MKMATFPIKLKAAHSRSERAANQSKRAGIMMDQSTLED